TAVAEDVMLIYLYAVPVFLLLGITADSASAVVGLRSPGALEMIGVSMFAGLIATTFAVLVGFYGAVASYRLGLDPDNHAIPVVTSSLDFLGALALILAIVALGLT
ncbi:MAG: magnesium transporter, partial [Acidimicrobiia bacterium]